VACDEPGYRSRITYSHADYFGLSEKEIRIATAKRSRPVPSLEQIHHAVTQMPCSTDIEKRDRAIFAFLILTGMRDGAVASMRLGLVDLSDGSVFQDARVLKTKFSKTFTSWFFPVGDKACEIVTDWVKYLAQEKLYGPDDPLFPATLVVLDKNRQFKAAGLDRKFWTNAGPIRKIVREAFISAGLPSYKPHSFRKTLARLMMKVCRTHEQIQAWSLNLGHEKPGTTFASYGQLDDHTRKDLLADISTGGSAYESPEIERRRLTKRLLELG
jgi:integrase/recombinase XerD